MSVVRKGNTRTQVPFSRGVRAGRKTRAMCPRCRQWIKPGEWMKPAAGRGNVMRHVSCPKVG